MSPKDNFKMKQTKPQLTKKKNCLSLKDFYQTMEQTAMKEGNY